MNKNNLFYVVIFTFAAAFFFVFFLALADGATKDEVVKNRQLAVQKAILSALDLLPDGEEDIPAVYGERFDRVPSPGELLETTLQGRAVLIRYYSGAGLWGTITGILAVDRKVDRIVGLEIVSHNETPGLGGRIDEAWFKEQFRNEALPEGTITVRKGEGGEDGDSSNGIVDGITGASLTSRSIQKIVNDELRTLSEGGN